MPRVKGASGKRKHEDPDKPKGKITAYAYFIRYKHEQKEGSLNSLPFSEFSKKCSNEWKEMPDEGRAPFLKMAAEDRDRFNEEMKVWTANGGKAKAKAAKKATKDENEPKRPKTAFFLFSSDMREKIKEEHPEYKVTDIARELGRLWREVDEETKNKYEKESQEGKDKYAVEIAQYRTEKKEREAKEAAELKLKQAEEMKKEKERLKMIEQQRKQEEARIKAENDKLVKLAKQAEKLAAKQNKENEKLAKKQQKQQQQQQQRNQTNGQQFIVNGNLVNGHENGNSDGIASGSGSAISPNYPQTITTPNGQQINLQNLNKNQQQQLLNNVVQMQQQQQQQQQMQTIRTQDGQIIQIPANAVQNLLNQQNHNQTSENSPSGSNNGSLHNGLNSNHMNSSHPATNNNQNPTQIIQQNQNGQQILIMRPNNNSNNGNQIMMTPNGQQIQIQNHNQNQNNQQQTAFQLQTQPQQNQTQNFQSLTLPNGQQVLIQQNQLQNQLQNGQLQMTQNGQLQFSHTQNQQNQQMQINAGQIQNLNGQQVQINQNGQIIQTNNNNNNNNGPQPGQVQYINANGQPAQIFVQNNGNNSNTQNQIYTSNSGQQQYYYQQ